MLENGSSRLGKRGGRASISLNLKKGVSQGSYLLGMFPPLLHSLSNEGKNGEGVFRVIAILTERQQ